MSVPQEKIPPLPKVASPPAWSWHYFRLRYLPTVASVLAVVTTVWLWALNLPESGVGAAGSSVAGSVNATPTSERQAGAVLSTNMPDLQTVVTNGNLGLGGGL